MEEPPSNLKKKLFIIGVLILTGVLFFVGKSALSSYYVDRGAAQIQAGDTDAAKQSFSNALRFNTKNSKAHAYMGKIALGALYPENEVIYPYADYPNAIKYFENSIQYNIKTTNPGLHSATLEWLGHAYRETREYGKMESVLLEKVSLYPRDAFWSRFILARHYINTPKTQVQKVFDVLLPATELVKTVLQKRNLYQVYSMLGRLANAREDYDGAKTYMELAIANAPKDTASFDLQIAHNILAILEGQKKNFSEAENHIKTAEKIAGKNMYGCVLGLAYLKGGETTKALSEAKKGDDPASGRELQSLCLRVLGDGNKQIGERKKAKEYYEAYLLMIAQPINIFQKQTHDKIQKEIQGL